MARTRLLSPLVRGIATLVLVSSVLAGTGSLSSAATLPHVWVEPGAGYGFVTTAINGARVSVDLSMYELNDPAIEAALMKKAASGVRVRVILDSAYAGASANAGSYAVLKNSRVQVVWANANQIFHAKYLVVDAKSAYVGTGNLTAQWYSSTRDFWVLDTAPADVASIEATFASDFSSRSGAQRASSSSLVWSPGATTSLVALMNSAHTSLLVENEEMYSYPIEDALVAAAARGVHVDVVMTYSSSWTSAWNYLASHGVSVRVLPTSGLYIHAKAICVDCSSGGEVFVGSQNFSTSSLSYNRELGVVTKDTATVSAVSAAITSDYASGSTSW